MNKYLDNLSNYKSEPQTASCFLDARYWDLVFKRYPGLRPTLYLEIKDKKQRGARKHGEEKVFRFHTEQKPITNTNLPGIARLSIKINNVSHSNVLIFDYQNKILYRLEPLGNVPGNYFNEINNFLEEMADGYELININLTTIPEVNNNCEKSGYCVAYAILYAYSFLTQTPFDPDHIRKFARHIEKRYGKISGPPEVEYGLFTGPNSNTGQNALLGGLTGGLIGTAVAGPTGLLVGGLGGAAIGSLV